MTYLPNLIKRVDDFSRHATALSLIKAAAEPYEDYEDYDEEPAPDYSQYDDPRYQGGQGKKIEEVTPIERDDEEPVEVSGEIGDLVTRAAQAIQQYSNSNIRDELAALVSGYAVALANPELDFYKLELDRIKNARISIRDNKELDSQEDEIENAEDFLNEMEVDLRPLVGTSKTPPMEKSAKEKMFAIKRREFLDTKFRNLSENIQETRQEEEDLLNKGITPNVYQEEGGKGDDFSKRPKPLMDPGGGNRQPINPAFERLTISKCENEIKSLEYSRQDSRNDSSIKQINDLIALDKQIIPAIVTLDEAEKNQITTPGEAEDQAVASARGNLDKLKALRTQLKINLRKIQQTKAFEDAQAIADRTTNTDEKKWLQYHADLAKLRSESTLNKTPAIKALKALIKATGTVVKRKEAKGLQVSYFEPLNQNKPELTSELKAKFQAAYKEMVRKDEYDRKRTEELGNEQGRTTTPTYDPFNYEQKKITPGGRRIHMENLPEEERINYETMSFKALLHEFGQDIGSATQASRQIIYEFKGDNNKKQIKTSYKDEIEKISEAVQTKNRQAIYDSQKKLTELILADAKIQAYHLKGYIEVIRLEPHFRKVLEAARTLTKKGPKIDESGNLVPANFGEKDVAFVEYILNDLNRLRRLYQYHFINILEMEKRRTGKLNLNPQWWALKKSLNPRFKKVISTMNKVEMRLTQTLSVKSPETTRLYPEHSPLLKEIGKTQKELPPFSERKWKSNSMALREEIFKTAQGIHKNNPLSGKDQKRIYDRIRTIDMGENEQNREEYIPSAPERGGPRKPQYLDRELFSFDALVHQFQNDINTGLGSVKAKLADPKVQGESHLKPYVDAVSTAITKGDSEAKYMAIRTLKEEVSKTLIHNEKLNSLIKLARLVPHFRNLKDDFKRLSKNDPAVNVTNLINRSERLMQICSKYYEQPGPVNLHLKQAIYSLKKITIRLMEGNYK
jgi:hypothetical protein